MPKGPGPKGPELKGLLFPGSKAQGVPWSLGLRALGPRCCCSLVPGHKGNGPFAPGLKGPGHKEHLGISPLGAKWSQVAPGSPLGPPLGVPWGFPSYSPFFPSWANRDVGGPSSKEARC